MRRRDLASASMLTAMVTSCGWRRSPWQPRPRRDSGDQDHHRGKGVDAATDTVGTPGPRGRLDERWRAWHPEGTTRAARGQALSLGRGIRAEIRQG